MAEMSGCAPPTMRDEVARALGQVPAGHVTTYGDIAKALGDVRAARAVGEILATNPFPLRVPCHRVVMADGALGGYAFGGPQAKARRLSAEGVEVRGGRVEPLESFAVRALAVDPLLARFARRQERLAARVRVGASERTFDVAIGVDASYAKADARAFAAAVALDLETHEEVASAVAAFTPPVPYVPGYLAFRELPGIEAAVQKLPIAARRRAVLIVDGQGILHPRRCGIASMAGLALRMPSIGVAKGKLVGTVERAHRMFGALEGRKVSIDREVRGFKLKSPSAARAMFVSPGTGVSVLDAARLAAALTSAGAPSPSPVLRADALSRRARSEEAEG